MNRCLGLCCLLSASVALGGCSTPPVGSQATGPATGPEPAVVALGELGPVRVDSALDDVFAFGAGDAIGQEVFIFYVASIRADEYFATGESPFLRDE